MNRFLPTAPYRGTRDFLPPQMSVRQQVLDRLYQVAESYGYLRYDGPVLEPAEIYEAKSGREVAELQLYTLTDRGGRRLALRPEMTPSVARMIAANAGALQFPVRWYCNVNCHRYERPQRGRLREHWQINVDIFGSDSSNADTEIFSVVHDMMAAVGATRDMYVLRASDRVLLESILTRVAGVPADRVRDVSAIIDRWEKAPRDHLRADAAEAGLTDAQFDRLAAVLEAGEDVLTELPPEILERSRLAQVLRSDAKDLVTFDPLIVRGLEYYTSTVFEVFDRHPANTRSLFGGGRYDDLVGIFSSRRIPGVGFGMGDVTLFDFLDTHGLLPGPRAEADVAVIPVTEDLSGAARSVAGKLRRAGWRTSVPVEVRKLGREIARAGQAGVRAIVIVGPGEWAEGNVTVRDLTTGEQRVVAAAAAVEAVTRLAKQPR